MNIPISSDPWIIHQGGYDVRRNLVYETNFTLANGYMGVRGALEEGADVENPGIFVLGVFNTGEDGWKTIVNTQNWLGIRVYVDGEVLSPDRTELLEFERRLDVRQGILFRRAVFRDKSGRETRIEGLRFLSRANMHHAGIQLFITPLNHDSRFGVESVIDAGVFNAKDAPRYRTKHLDLVESGVLRSGDAYLETVTTESGIHIATGSALRLTHPRGGTNIGEFSRNATFGERNVQYREFNLSRGATVEVNKHVVTRTSRETDASHLKTELEWDLENFTASGMALELEQSIESFRELWEIRNIDIEGDPRADNALKFNIFHLANSVNERDSRVNIGAKALHGEGYKGLVFWDTEIYLLPFFLFTWPEAARTLVRYRYNMLDGARRNAALYGCRGAKYPWNSADTGDEEARNWAINQVGEVIRFEADTQIHVVADVAFGVYEYCRVTDDKKFLIDCGLEILLETARYWATRVEYNAELDRYEINNIIGPDEFHLQVDNNFYTNYLAKWNLDTALRLREWMLRESPGMYRSLESKICLTEDELNQWRKVSEKLYIPYGKGGLIEQFEGYFKLKDFTVQAHDENNMPAWPEGADPGNTAEAQLIKQADVLMAILLFPDAFDEDVKRLNYDYYERRTMHKSTLSASSHAILSLRQGHMKNAYDNFIRTAETDLVDSQGSTGEGIHIASCGGTWQVAFYGFAGIHVDEEGTLCLNPMLPGEWSRLSLKLNWRNRLLAVDITPGKAAVNLLKGDPLIVKIDGKSVSITSVQTE